MMVMVKMDVFAKLLSSAITLRMLYCSLQILTRRSAYIVAMLAYKLGLYVGKNGVSYTAKSQ